jgi:hypothetical protein
MKATKMLYTMVVDSPRRLAKRWWEIILGYIVLFTILITMYSVYDLIVNELVVRKVNEQASAQCLESGYPDYRVADELVYCVRIENGTEKVIRLDAIGK